MIFAQRGGLYVFIGKEKNIGKNKVITTYYFSISPDIKIKLVCIDSRTYINGSFEKIKNETIWLCGSHLKELNPDKACREYIFKKTAINKKNATTLWDWACVYLYETNFCSNEKLRREANSLMNKDFCRISKSLDIKEWDGLHYRDICIFNGEANELARNAHYWAARHGYISVPHISKIDIIKKEDVF